MRRNWCRSFLSTLDGAARRCGAATAVGGLVLVMASTTAQAQPKGAPKGAPKAAPAAPAAPKAAPKPKLTKKQREEEAAKLFGEGKAKFQAGDYAGAYEAFKSADELVPDPPVPKFRMAESLDKQGDVEGAIKAYENFLAAKPRPVEDKERIETANARIAALKMAPADVKVTLLPPEAAAATFTLDGAPATNPVKVPPGKHTIVAKLAGFEDGKVEVDVQRGEKKEVTITLTAKPAEVPVTPVDKPVEKPVEKPKPAEPKSSSSKIPAIVTLSLAGAGVVVGAVFGGLALKSKGEYDDGPTQDLFDETERNALIADMSFGVALTFGVTGVVLLLTDSGSSSDKEKDTKKAGLNFIMPYATPQGAGAVGQFSF